VESLDRQVHLVRRESPVCRVRWDPQGPKVPRARKESLARSGLQVRKVSRAKPVRRGGRVTSVPWGWPDHPVQGGSQDLQVHPVLRGNPVPLVLQVPLVRLVLPDRQDLQAPRAKEALQV
jgi:hypothetical protein